MIIILLIIASIFNTEMDKIYWAKDRSMFPKWEWWNDNRWMNRSWWIKVPFSMFLDGWHFSKFIFLASMGAVIWLLTDNFLYGLGYYVGQGVIHELYYKIKISNYNIK